MSSKLTPIPDDDTSDPVLPMPSGLPVRIEKRNEHEWVSTPYGHTDVNAPTYYRCWWAGGEWRDVDALPLAWLGVFRDSARKDWPARLAALDAAIAKCAEPLAETEVSNQERAA
jgi:hypothetical protein